MMSSSNHVGIKELRNNRVTTSEFPVEILRIRSSLGYDFVDSAKLTR